MDKIFLTANDLLRDSFELGLRVYESGFRPSFIVGIWRGGAPIGIAVQEVLDYYGVKNDHIAIRTSSYVRPGEQSSTVRVFGLNYIIDNIDAADDLLIVDDTFDSGRSIDAVITEIQRKCRRNTPEDIRVATVFYKPTLNRTDRAPDYFIHETDRWIVFPHEIDGLTPEEIARHKVHNGLDRAR
ncbi:MAG: phosphoribosyltransferase [Minwuia sp.]|uniref:phosphoribosyltransferase n=1 Tax=Minwuia sp. TaxID=2493630 RepID=UPI003A87519F